MSSNNRYKLENNSDLETINSFKILISNIKALKDKTWGCPWQKIQSHISLIPFLYEESNEMKSSISRNLNLKIKNLPPTVGTDKITNVVKEHGFKWESTDEIFKKLEEEINELKEAIKSKNDSEIKNEFGDIYFTLLNLSNFLKINPESALQKTNIKFLDRFSIVEEHAGDNIKKQTPKDFQRLWQIAKQKLAGKIPKSK